MVWLGDDVGVSTSIDENVAKTNDCDGKMGTLPLPCSNAAVQLQTCQDALHVLVLALNFSVAFL